MARVSAFLHTQSLGFQLNTLLACTHDVNSDLTSKATKAELSIKAHYYIHLNFQHVRSV